MTTPSGAVRPPRHGPPRHQSEFGRLFRTLDTLLSIDWQKGMSEEYSELLERIGGESPVEVAISDSHTVITLADHGISEVRIDLPDDEDDVLVAMREHFGDDQECANTYKRIHRWYAGGHEVRLDAGHDGVSCYMVA